VGKEMRAFREDLIKHVQHLDGIPDTSGLDEEGWALRYHLEDQIIALDGL
jgi:hypothetical protein